MKKLAIVVMLMSLVALPAYAQLGDTDNASFTIQNVGTAAATVTVTFYNESGTSYTPNPILEGVANPFTLAAADKREIYMPAVLSLPDGRYSVVIESTEPVAVIANLIGETTGGTFYNGSYSGFDEGAGTIFFPATYYSAYGWYSLMSIQNTTAGSITADLYIYDAAGTQVGTDTQTIPAFASYHWDLETAGAGLGLTAGLNGSAKVVCSGGCVGTDNQTAAGGYTQSYNAFLGGNTTLFGPALYNGYYTWDTSLKVQNIGTGPTQIAVTYYIAGGGTCSPPAETIQPNQALYHYLPSMWSGWGCADVTNKAIAAKITSTAENIVGVVNGANPGGQAQTYGTADQGAASVGLPVIMNQYYNWDTSFTCQNVDDTASATVTYNYGGLGCPADPQYAGCTYTLAAGESKEVYQPADLDTTTGLYAVTVTATGAPIACIANETNGPGQVAGTGDWSMSYNGFGQ